MLWKSLENGLLRISGPSSHLAVGCFWQCSRSAYLMPVGLTYSAIPIARQLCQRSTVSKSRCQMDNLQSRRSHGQRCSPSLIDSRHSIHTTGNSFPAPFLKFIKSIGIANKQRRQLFGYSIAAKRYAIYTKTKNDIEIVEPKAHGLGYFYPPKDSPEGWKHDTPKWIFEAWDWIMRGVLGLKREKPAWFDLPVMMKLTLSTPHHALRNLAKGPLTRPHNFMMLPQISRFGHPEDVDPNNFTLITPFSSDRDQWMQSKCINIHDSQSPVYELTDEYDGRKAVVKNFFMLLDSYQNHPEAKSLGPDGKPCNSIREDCCSERTSWRIGHRSTSAKNPTSIGKKAKI